jgi:hypothetical protein
MVIAVVGLGLLETCYGIDLEELNIDEITSIQ